MTVEEAIALTMQQIEALQCELKTLKTEEYIKAYEVAIEANQFALAALEKQIENNTKDLVEVVRCKDCIHAVPFDKNCEINTKTYRHCNALRGEETNNVWHKYTKHYKDYSVVDISDFCSCGTRNEE